jgi:uncharacterized tellurite resistance protein B-like protein
VPTRFDKYDVIMKMLEIIQQDGAIDAGSVSADRVTQITNIISRLDGNIIQQQIATEEVSMGDTFENVSQSVIATRGSFAHGVITIKERHGDETADAFRAMESALKGQAGAELTEEQRKEALDLLTEMAQQGAKPDSSKSVLRSLGKSLWTLIENAEPLSKACAVAWPFLERLWS